VVEWIITISHEFNIIEIDGTPSKEEVFESIKKYL